MPDFHATLDTSDRCAVVRVSGELDIATTPQLEEVLGDAAASGGPLVIDLTETTFSDSTGMTAVLRAHKRAAVSGAVMAVVCPESNAEVTRVLRLLGFDGVLNLHDRLGTAVDELCGAAGPNADAS